MIGLFMVLFFGYRFIFTGAALTDNQGFVLGIITVAEAFAEILLMGLRETIRNNKNF